MALNIQASSPITTDTLQTVNRPLLIKYEYTGTGTIPKLVEVQAEGNVDGSWVKIGSPLIQEYDYDSLVNNPTFTFDFSEVLRPILHHGFYEDLLTMASDTEESMKNSTNSDRMGVTEVKFEATTWSESGQGILTKDEEDEANFISNPTASGVYHIIVDSVVSDSEVITDKMNNLAPHPNWVWEDSGGNVEFENKTFMTNCPESLRRRIKVGQPFLLNMLKSRPASASTVSLYADYSHTTADVTEELLQGTNVAKVDWDILNYTFNNTYLFSESGQPYFNEANITGNVSLYAKLSTRFSKKLNFYVTDLANSDNSHRDTTAIYFINDLGALDFYNFEGGLEITMNHEKSTYVIGDRDYTSRQSPRNGVARSVTNEIHTCYSKALNKDAKLWLSELIRSRAAWTYDFDARAMIPIIIIDSDIQPLSFDKSNASVAISFIKETTVIKG